MLKELKLRLKKGGRIYIGFGPLFHSPSGDHGWIRKALPGGLSIPWSHLLLPRPWLLKILSKYYGREITNFSDWQFLVLNELTVSDFKRIFQESGLRILVVRANVGYSPIAKIFALIGRFPPLAKYFTQNIFCILEKWAKFGMWAATEVVLQKLFKDRAILTISSRSRSNSIFFRERILLD